MKRIDALLNGIKDLETPENRTTIKKLTEGINLMANEYRRRKSAESKALHEAIGFAEIDESRRKSGLSDKAFLEGVGNDIIKSNYPDETKQKLMAKLSDYSKYLTEANNGRLGPFGMISLLAGFQNVVNQLGRKLKNKMPLTNPEMRLLNGVIALKNNIGETEWNQISGVKQPNPTAQPNPAAQPAQQPATQPQQ